MGFKIDLKLDTPSLRKAITKTEKMIKDNVVSVLKNEAIPHLIDLIMKGFDDLSDRADMLPEDPTNPSNWRQEFLNKITEDFQQTFTVTDKGVMIRIGEKDFFGYGHDDRNDPTPLVWLVYYIEGLAGEWGFITPELYDEFRGAGAFKAWGRFSQGFMISKEQFDDEGWSEVTTFDAVRHPFSGYSPVDIFNEALNEFELRPFIQKAIKAAAQGRKL